MLKTNIILVLIFCVLTPFTNGIAQTPAATTTLEYPVHFEIKRCDRINNECGWTFGEYATGYQCGWVYHPGWDINKAGTSGNGDLGEIIYPVADGIVIAAKKNDQGEPPSWGELLIMHSIGSKIFISQYGHVRKILVDVGDTVIAGVTPIAEIGNVGTQYAHLHLEIRTTQHVEWNNPNYWECKTPYGLRDLNAVQSWYYHPEYFIKGVPVVGMKNNGTYPTASEKFFSVYFANQKSGLNSSQEAMDWDQVWDRGPGDIYVHYFPNKDGETGDPNLPGHEDALWVQDFKTSTRDNNGTPNELSDDTIEYSSAMLVYDPYRDQVGYLKDKILQHWIENAGYTSYGPPVEPENNEDAAGKGSGNYAGGAYGNAGNLISAQVFQKGLNGAKKTLLNNPNSAPPALGNYPIGRHEFAGPMGAQWYQVVSGGNEVPWPKDGVVAPTGRWWLDIGSHEFVRKNVAGQIVGRYQINIEEGGSASAGKSIEKLSAIFRQPFVELTWADPNTLPETPYVVFRNGTPIATVETQSFRDQSVALGETYSYSIGSANGVTSSSVTISIPKTLEQFILVGTRDRAFDVIDATSDNVIFGPFLRGRIGDRALYDIVVTPDGKTAIVSYFGKFVYFLDMNNPLEPKVRGEVYLGFDSEDLALTPDGGFVLATDGANTQFPTITIGHIAVINVKTLGIIQNFELGASRGAQAVDVAADGETILILDWATSRVHIYRINPNNGKLTDLSIARRVTPGPFNITISPIGRTALVAGSTAITILKINNPGEVSVFGEISNIQRAQSIAFNPDETKAYVVETGTNPDRLAILSVSSSGEVLDSGDRINLLSNVSGGFFGVDVIAVSRDGTRAYVGNPKDAGTLSRGIAVIDLKKLQLIANLPMSHDPTGVAISGGTPPTSVDLDMEMASDQKFEFRLQQNFPNPFNPVTVIGYILPFAGRVSLKLYDLSGKEVLRLVDQQYLEAGYHEAMANMKNYGSGVYFYRIFVDGSQTYSASKKLLLIR